MLGRSLEEIKAMKRNAQMEIAAAYAERRRLRTAPAHRVWLLTEMLIRVVLIIYTLADGAVDPAMVFLREEGRRRGWPGSI